MKNRKIIPCCLAIISMTAISTTQATWAPDGTDVKDPGALTFSTTSIPTLYSDKPGSAEVALTLPPNPAKTKEWKVEGITHYIIGGVKTEEPKAKVPYPDKKGTKNVSGAAHYTAKPTPANEYSTADAHPVLTTDTTLPMTRA